MVRLNRVFASRRPLSETEALSGTFPLRREHLYLLGFLLGIANTGFQSVFADAQANGLIVSLANLFGISALVWAGLPAIVSTVLEGKEQVRTPSYLEIALFVLVLLACFVPLRAAAAGATSLLAIFAIATSPWRSPLSRAAFIALACVAALYWGRVLLAMSGTALLDLDVLLAGTFSGLEAQGNMLLYASTDPEFAGDGFLVAAGCSSLHGISLALLTFVLTTQFYNLPFSPQTMFWGLVGVLSTIAINIARLSAMGYYPEHFEWIHVGTGAAIAGIVSLALVLAANLGGNWRAITSID